MLFTDLLSSVSNDTFPLSSRSLFSFLRHAEAKLRTQKMVIPIPRDRKMRNRRMRSIGTTIKRMYSTSKGRSLFGAGVASPVGYKK